MKYTKLLELITDARSPGQIQWIKGYLAALRDNSLIKQRDYNTLAGHLARRLRDITF